MTLIPRKVMANTHHIDYHVERFEATALERKFLKKTSHEFGIHRGMSYRLILIHHKCFGTALYKGILSCQFNMQRRDPSLLSYILWTGELARPSI